MSTSMRSWFLALFGFELNYCPNDWFKHKSQISGCKFLILYALCEFTDPFPCISVVTWCICPHFNFMYVSILKVISRRLKVNSVFVTVLPSVSVVWFSINFKTTHWCIVRLSPFLVLSGLCLNCYLIPALVCILQLHESISMKNELYVFLVY